MTTLAVTPFACSYNGVNFAVAETDTTSCTIRPVYDRAQRTVIHNVYSITLKSYLYVNSPGTLDSTDSGMTAILRRLTTPGGAFLYVNKGLGNLVINTQPLGGIAVGAAAGGIGAGLVPVANNPVVTDAVWGPKPRLIQWKPTGSAAACEVIFQVEVAIPLCDNATYRMAPMEFNFKLSWSNDQGGYTRRIYSGFIRIPQTRATVTTRTLLDSADNYREQINPAVPVGFRRIPGAFSLSEDKCTLDFSISDEMMPPNYPPEDIVEVSAEHTMETEPRSLYKWTASLSATYEVRRDRPKERAYEEFYKLYLDRIENTKKFGIDAIGQQGPQRPTKGCVVVPVKLMLSEPEIYGRKCARFTVQYCYVTSIQTVVQASSLWRPVPGNNYGKWATSMKEVFGVRGLAGMNFNVADDLIVDLCLSKAIKVTPPYRGGGLDAPGSAPPPPNVKIQLLADPFSAERPEEDSSWLDYQLGIDVAIQDGVAEVELLPTTRTPLQYGVVAKTFDDDSGYDPPYNRAPPSLAQYQAKPRIAVTLYGFALRAGFTVTPPVLTKAGGSAIIPANRWALGNGYGTRTIATYSVPIVYAWWNFRYLLTGLPMLPFDVPDNPTLGNPQ